MGKTLKYKSVVVPASGEMISLDVAGSYFLCAASLGRFQVSFDGQTFSDWQKGITGYEPFTRLSFRQRPGATIVNPIEFYYGDAEVKDSRLIVIDNSSLATIQTISPRTIIRRNAYCNTTIPFANGHTEELTDPWVIDGVSHRRAFLQIANTTGGANLSVYKDFGLPEQNLIGLVIENSIVRFEVSGLVTLAAEMGAVNIAVQEAFYQDPDFFL